jgi:hypothetical protein
MSETDSQSSGNTWHVDLTYHLQTMTVPAAAATMHKHATQSRYARWFLELLVYVECVEQCKNLRGINDNVFPKWQWYTRC